MVAALATFAVVALGVVTSCGAPRLTPAEGSELLDHAAIVHACRIGDASLIGMGAIVLDGVVVEPNGFVGAGALVSPGKVVRSGELWLGNPARCVRRLGQEEIDALLYSAGHYVWLKDDYLQASGA